MPQPKFIYFDIGGVLLEYEHALKKIAEANGITTDDFQTIYIQYEDQAERGEITLDDLWKVYKKTLSLKEENDFNFLEYWTDQLLPIEENHDTLNELIQSHRVGIISNIYTDVFMKVIQKKKIPDVPYATIIQSCEVKLRKPEEKIYQLAQHTAGVSPTDIIYIDDKKDFVDFARTLGWNGIWYDKGNRVNLKENLAHYLS
jgi:putative hydrolase of the HAD superfamily